MLTRLPQIHADKCAYDHCRMMFPAIESDTKQYYSAVIRTWIEISPEVNFFCLELQLTNLTTAADSIVASSYIT